MPLIARDVVSIRIQIAIAILKIQDTPLFSNESHEVAVSHKLGSYLGPLFSHWDVDCEYNRVNDTDDWVKRRKSGDWFRPDVAIHQRGKESKDDNLLHIEIKIGDKDTTDDEEKLKETTIKQPMFHYQHGLSLKFKQDCSSVEAKWFEEGCNVSHLIWDLRFPDSLFKEKSLSVEAPKRIDC